MLVLEPGQWGEAIETVPALSGLETLSDRVRTVNYRILTRLLRRNDRFFTSDRGSRTGRFASQIGEVEVLHLHWVSFLLDQPTFLASLPANLPIVWTTHDLNPITGGCHVPYECRKFTTHCRSCPQLRIPGARDLSYRVFERKLKARQGRSITYVSPSRWATEQVASSAITRGATRMTIPLGMDTDAFAPQPKAEARARLGLPVDRFLVGFIAQYLDDANKDLATLGTAMAGQSEWQLVTVGERGIELPNDLTVHALGRLSGVTELAAFYSAMDVVAVPSRFESFGQAASEASACGTPVVASDTSGLRDVVVDGETGLFFPAGDSEALRSVLTTMHEMGPGARMRLGIAARERAVSEFGLEAYARRYLDLYRSLVSGVAGD